MLNFEENALVTISPDVPLPTCGATKFQWNMHVALPFVMPSRDCPSARFERGGRSYLVQFHNHFDRQISLRTGMDRSVPIVQLVPKLKDGEQPIPPPAGCTTWREHLQAVAVFTDAAEHESITEAFKEADKKITHCFEYMGEHLGKLQRSLPYLVTWTLYPVSVFDVGVVYHSVDHLCPKTGAWTRISGGIAISLARQLRAPLFLAQIDQSTEVPPELDLANELLAEAQLAIFRRLPRLAVLNSFTAVETLANAVFKRQRKQQLLAWGVPEVEAERLSENERKKNRTDEKFLLGAGMKHACNRSLIDEDKPLYDEVVRFEENIRHQVSHRGARPATNDDKACFRACCRCVRWLCDVAGYPKKEMAPAPEVSAHGFSASGGTEPHVCSASEMEVLRRMFRIVLPRQSTGPADAQDAQPGDH